MAKFIDIVLADDPDSALMKFVEVEDENGRSVEVGEFFQREDGYWVLLLMPRDMEQLDPEEIKARHAAFEALAHAPSNRLGRS
jgi:hypothetical protein